MSLMDTGPPVGPESIIDASYGNIQDNTTFGSPAGRATP